jgi:hypothetical protein
MKARTRTLWVDAICINQKSLEERNKQVVLMGDIYKCAQRVLIWLGEASEASEQVLHQLRRVERSYRHDLYSGLRSAQEAAAFNFS